MKTEIKEQLINEFDRAIKRVDAVGKAVLLVLVAYAIPMILYQIGVFVHQMPYKMFDLLFPIGVGIGFCICIVSQIYNSLKYAIEHENVDFYKNSIPSIVLSNKGTISNIIFYMLVLTTMVENAVLFCIVLILYIVVPSRLSRHFKSKLVKEKEL